MKKMMLFLTMVAICLVAVVGCCKKCDSQAQTGRTFTVGFDASFPPYGFQDKASGEYIGFDLDLAKEVAQRNSWNIVLKPIDWDAKDAELNAGTIDCIWNGFTISDARKDKYTWTSPYVRNAQFILVKKGSDIKTLADLNGKRVVSQEGSSGAESLEKFVKESAEKNPAFKLADYKKVPEYNTAYMMLETGAIDAIALDSAVANGFIEKSKGLFVVLNEPLALEVYGVGFKLGNTELRDVVEETLKQMVADGTVQKILAKWAARHEDGGDGIDFVLK